MPTSRLDRVPDVASILATIKPNSFLDVGCGFGRWGFLAREVCDVCAGRYYKKDWKTRIDAVEAFGDYIQPWHREIYDNIYVASIQDHTMEHYDVIFAGDILEHLDVPDIRPVLSKLLAHADKALLVAVPIGSYPQGEAYGNPYERHRSTWTIGALKSFKPDYIKTYSPGRPKALAVWSGPRLWNMGPRLNKSWLFVAYDGWANSGYLFSKALNSVGVRAKAICFKPGTLGYPEQAELCAKESYAEYVANADIIVGMQSLYFPCNLTDKQLFIFHGGSLYRDNSSRLNNAFNQIVTGTLLQHHEFLDHGAKNEHWLLPPVDTNLIQPDYSYHGKTFAHYPHKPGVKGSPAILKVMQSLNGRFEYSSSMLPWLENQKRMSECDVYIEQLCSHEWGMTATEAAALGKIVITTFRGLDRYKKEYGECELVIANTPEELTRQVQEILTWSEEEVLAKKKATRKWVETNHSFEAIGRRLGRIGGCSLGELEGRRLFVSSLPDKKVEQVKEIKEIKEIEKTEGYYDQFVHLDTSRYEEIYKLVGEWAQGTALDIGCGVAKLRHHVKNYSGFDFNAKNVKMANTNKVWKGDAYTEDLGDYDTYVSTEVLEHLDDLRLIRRLPAGKPFIFSVPSFTDGSHLRTYTEEGLRNRYSQLMNIEQTVRFNIHNRRWVVGGRETGRYIILVKAMIRGK